MQREDTGVVPANLGAGAVLVDLDGVGPRALLLRRRKPPVGLWENPGGMLEEGEDFVACAGRELYEETGVRAGIEDAWWARVEPWRGPEDPELYAGVGFLARHPGGEIEPETAAHDASMWATETEWRSLRTWYTERESDVLWKAIKGDAAMNVPAKQNAEPRGPRKRHRTRLLGMVLARGRGPVLGGGPGRGVRPALRRAEGVGGLGIPGHWERWPSGSRPWCSGAR